MKHPLYVSACLAILSFTVLSGCSTSAPFITEVAQDRLTVITDVGYGAMPTLCSDYNSLNNQCRLPIGADAKTMINQSSEVYKAVANTA